MNDFFVSVSADLPRLDPTHRVFDIVEPLPAELPIEAASTQRALQKVKFRKATGPDNIPPWMLAAPVTAIFTSSLREGKLSDIWKTATIVPLPKKHPPGSLESDIRPISLTPILAKVVEASVLNWVDDAITPSNWRTPIRGIIRHRYDGRLGGDGPHVVRGYRQVRYFRTSGRWRLEQSVRSHQPRNTHWETMWHMPSCTSCKVDGNLPDRPSTVRQNLWHKK